MLYSEFIEGTGCKDNEKNYKVYKDLEVMYMNSDMSKAEIYEYGRKLVDNSKSKEQVRLEKEINAEIETRKQQIGLYKHDIEWKQTCIKEWNDDKEWVKNLRAEIRYLKAEIKKQKNRIAELKWVLA